MYAVNQTTYAQAAQDFAFHYWIKTGKHLRTESILKLGLLPHRDDDGLVLSLNGKIVALIVHNQLWTYLEFAIHCQNIYASIEKRQTLQEYAKFAVATLIGLASVFTALLLVVIAKYTISSHTLSTKVLPLTMAMFSVILAFGCFIFFVEFVEKLENRIYRLLNKIL